MNIKPINVNLGLPESGVTFREALFFKSEKLCYVPDFRNYSTSCNIKLLNILDECNVSRGKISFLPIDLLRKLGIKYDIKTYNLPVLEEKHFLIQKLILKEVFNESFFKNTEYKGVPLTYLRKPLLKGVMSKAIDNAQLMNDNINEINNVFKIKKYNHDVIKDNSDEWLSTSNINELLLTKLFLLQEKQEFISYIPPIYIETNYTNRYLIDNKIKKLISGIDKSKRFIMFVILYRQHFTSVFIDTKCKTKVRNDETLHYKKNAYFFNSTKYDYKNFKRNPNYWFIDSSCGIHRQTDLLDSESIQTPEDDENGPIEALCDVLNEEYGVTNFIFNSFETQFLNSECGIFSSMFLICILKLINSRNIDDIINNNYLFVYNNMLKLGCDLNNSMFRGLFFFSFEDLERNNINSHIYLDSPLVYDTQNEKYKNYKKIYQKNLELLNKNFNMI